MQGVGVERTRTRQPRLVIETRSVNDERVAFPASDRIPQVARYQIVWMFRVQRDDAEDIHVLIKHDDLRGSLDDLLREQTQHYSAWNTGGQALPGGIIDASSVVGLQNFLRGPRLVRRSFSSRRPVVGRESHSRLRVASTAAHSHTAVRLFPRAARCTASLPHAR